MPEMIWVASLEYEGSIFVVPRNALDSITDEMAANFDDREERTYTLKVKQMIREAFDALPEFDGF